MEWIESGKNLCPIIGHSKQDCQHHESFIICHPNSVLHAFTHFDNFDNYYIFIFMISKLTNFIYFKPSVCLLWKWKWGELRSLIVKPRDIFSHHKLRSANCEMKIVLFPKFSLSPKFCCFTNLVLPKLFCFTIFFFSQFFVFHKLCFFFSHILLFYKFCYFTIFLVSQIFLFQNFCFFLLTNMVVSQILLLHRYCCFTDFLVSKI